MDAIRHDRIRYTVVRIPGGRPPIPTTKALSRLVRVALEASLAREEGRAVVASLVFDSPGHATDLAFRFKPEMPLDPEGIRRLAPAIEDSRGLGVSASPVGDLSVWGITKRRQDAVEVRVVQPGRVIVKFGLVNVAFIEGGRCQLVGCTLADLLHALSRLAGASSEPYVLVPYLVHLGVAIRSRGHGGSVVLLGTADRKPHSEGLRIDPPFNSLKARYESTISDFQRSLQDSPDENEIYLLSILPDIEALFDGAMPANTARIIRALSGFALVDGALLFDRNLTLLRGGAILKSKQKRKSWTWDEWTPGQRWRRRHGAHISKLGGTRHRSAFRFVVENPGAVAVVCSQDGSISMMSQPARSEYPLIARGIERAVT